MKPPTNTLEQRYSNRQGENHEETDDPGRHNVVVDLDGSVHPDDEKALREVGRRIRAEGWPGEGTA
jgi:hypothetical protein